jgi:hypothetical protein
MRDYRDAKAMAQTIRAALAAKGLKITIGESLELIAKALGAGDWNTLAATIKAEPKGAAEPPAAAPSEPTPLPAELAADPPGRRSGNYFSAGLEKALHAAVGLASERRHQYTTLEHLLLALTSDPDAVEVMQACQVDVAALQARSTRYIDEELKSLVMQEPTQPAPTAGFHRVIQRSVIHVQSSGRGGVTGANVLVAIFSERESHAYAFLTIEGITRWDAVNFIAHGVRKGGPAA